LAPLSRPVRAGKAKQCPRQVTRMRVRNPDLLVYAATGQDLEAMGVEPEATKLSL